MVRSVRDTHVVYNVLSPVIRDGDFYYGRNYDVVCCLCGLGGRGARGCRSYAGDIGCVFHHSERIVLVYLMNTFTVFTWTTIVELSLVVAVFGIATIGETYRITAHRVIDNTVSIRYLYIASYVVGVVYTATHVVVLLP